MQAQDAGNDNRGSVCKRVQCPLHDPQHVVVQQVPCGGHRVTEGLSQRQGHADHAYIVPKTSVSGFGFGAGRRHTQRLHGRFCKRHTFGLGNGDLGPVQCLGQVEQTPQAVCHHVHISEVQVHNPVQFTLQLKQLQGVVGRQRVHTRHNFHSQAHDADVFGKVSHDGHHTAHHVTCRQALGHIPQQAHNRHSKCV